MNTKFKTLQAFYVLTLTIILFTACKKEESVTGNPDPNNTSAIVVLASGSSQQSDSLYIVNSCDRDERRDSISQANLPTSVSTYLSANYQGYNYHRAFVIKNTSGTTTGYVVVIYYNDRPVGLRFDANGNFVKVLEQREREDMHNGGFHHGGRFEHRDGLHRDTISLSSVPVNILTYMLTNYASDTLALAFRDREGNIVLLTRNNGAFATIFNSSGSFKLRTALTVNTGSCQSIDQGSLPATVSSYLNTTYPNFVFKKAFVIRQGTTIKGYIVFIDANNTKYAVEFDATGAFVRAKTIF
ncbi:MAG: PepSY-like domain-containing protein [Candidatus Dadabacteria bacterium]